jgi:large subunit ribosomal protein L29
MKARDLREKNVEDLAELRKALTRDVFQNRLKNFTNRLDDTSSIRKTRRDLARVITLLQERAASAPAPVAEAPGAPAAAAAPETTTTPATEDAPRAKREAKAPSKKVASAKKAEAK